MGQITTSGRPRVDDVRSMQPTRQAPALAGPFGSSALSLNSPALPVLFVVRIEHLQVEGLKKNLHLHLQ